MLSDRRIRALKSAHCDKWYSDGNGLYLRVRATGGRSWVLRRKRGGHVEVITVGAWPALGLDRLDPTLKATKLRNLERVEVRHALRRYAEERGPIAANRALSILKTALRFAVDAGYLQISPVDRLSSELIGGTEVSRDRVLTDEELRKLWQTSSSHSPLLRFLLLTGQRIGEAQRATWSHVLGERQMLPRQTNRIFTSALTNVTG